MPSVQTFVLFVTAQSAPPKALNVALRLIQDTNYNSFPDDIFCSLLTTNTLPPLTADPLGDDDSANVLPPTPLPLPVIDAPATLAPNAWSGKTLTDVNAFMRAHDHLPNDNFTDEHADSEGYYPYNRWEDRGCYSSLWLVLDDKALATGTCLVCQQQYREGEGEEGMTNDFRAARMLYEDVSGMLTQLSIANMDFEDFVHEEEQEEGEEPDVWMGDPVENHSQEERDAILEEWKAEGYVD
ncbi:hypothetical protein C8F01DRAFT_1136288 [Mycena amicta]|nr:hypothetical protein C8F01DRAFT_1136288 [Mycena amicta]